MSTEPGLVNSGASFVALAIYVIAWGLTLSAGAVFLERRRGSRWVWAAWLVLLLFATGVGTIGSQRYFPGAGTIPGSLYILGMFTGVPTAALAWAATRSGRSEVKPSWIRQIAHAFAAFVLAVPLAIALAALPHTLAGVTG